MNLKAMVGRQLNLHAIRRHRSRVGWRIAPIYSGYLARCRREAPPIEPLDEPLRSCVEGFERDAVTFFHTPGTQAVAQSMSRRIAEREAAGEAVWMPLDPYGGRGYAGDLWRDFPELEQLFRGDLGRFLCGYFNAPFKIFYGTMYRSIVLDDGRMGSQKWHSDSGPGICVNVMYYLHDMGPDDGALEALPWEQSMEIYHDEPVPPPGPGRRDALCAHYDRVIDANYVEHIVRPTGSAGLVVPFLNNTLHRGGFPKAGRTRTAIVFHCYPSHRATDYERYRRLGIAKSTPYPKDPSADF